MLTGNLPFIRIAIFGLLMGVLIVAPSCSRGEPQSSIHPFVLVGVDGADWEVIEWMWEEDRLPHLKQLADRGVAAPLETFHHASPVIWTTVATGVMPEVHGITEFVVPTDTGDQPVASTLRRVPALWNMVTASGGRVAVVGWWASWPVEEVNGVIVSDRAVHEIPDRVWPPEYLADFDAELAALRAAEKSSEPRSMLIADRVFSRTAVDLAGEDYDLTLIYLRGVDISCHHHWRAFEPEAFPAADPDQLQAERELIAREYELVDRTLGELVATSGAEANIILMSDHGFDATVGETTHIRLNFDAVLEHLGFLTKSGGGVDFARSRLYSYASPERSLVKKIRFSLAGREDGGQVTESQRTAIRDRLEAELEAVRYRGGAPVFTVRDATKKELRQGADFSIEVLTEGAHKPLEVGGVALRGAIRSLNRLTGTHGRRTAGVFIAAGPDIDRQAEPDSLRVIDVPPIVLYAIGLPVAEDFAGRARIEIFTETFRSAHPLQTIPTWGKPVEGENRASAVDEELVDQLRALGYIE
jgi:predicted AlkP superfamily phosphohydrolase/phosphomutase